MHFKWPERRTLVLILILVVLALVSQWLLSLNEAGRQGEEATLRHEPDYTMENFVITGMNERGQPTHKLQAPLMVHYADDGSAEFTQPAMTLYQKDAAPWEVRSARGWMSKDRKRILLQGEVLIENPAAPARDVWRIETHDLTLLPDAEYAETSAPVTITGQTSVTRGVGMQIFIKEGRLKLLSKVRGRYEAKKR
ncbi:MAG: LPS export ABC transporter periplasmic protein LptC [Gammaproteobacteria bacterium]|nr:LPS export ABC transporter periplasmic protein LptC [Gammaproteobacteria bacterium]